MIIRTYQGLLMRSEAHFSDCEKYRYLLERVWDDSLPLATFILMNPSTATEMVNDPTVTRMQRRAEAWAETGFLKVGGVAVGNVYGWRETDSKQLPILIKAGIDIVGPDNDTSIMGLVARSAIVVFGSGRPGHKHGRAQSVIKMVREAGHVPHAFGINNDGSPVHPLYQAYATQPMPIP